ncbi:restriction endonuclease subunit S [Sphingomonas sp. 35-24ZXX]|uniref:restriction endonuclease subunit S n=1 Tax=Sphingomonas sp. 35-24ZXX TaxID=1545915 RepID=UPI0009DEC1CA|nr:restriction endonuclease subunit S [Sphingomonas sp. 35-24ZXX]
MSAWPTVALKDCVRVVGGATPKSGSADFWDGDVPWTTPKDLSDLNGKFLSDTPRKITELGLKSCAAELLPANSVLFSSRAPIGHVAINSVPMATNQGFKSMVPGPKVDASFLYWWLKCHRAEIELLGNGATFKEVSKSVVERIEVPLPPLDEQKRIAAILDQADELRRKRQRAIDRLNQLGQAIFYEMFGDPVINPMGFAIRNLREFYISEKDGTKCGPFGSALKKEEVVDSGIPVWNMDNIGLDGDMLLPHRMWITERKFRELKSYSVVDGDVIISRAGTVGKMCVAHLGGKTSIISTNLIRVRFGPNLLPTFFVSLMTYCKGKVGRLKTGPDGSFTHMNTGVLDNLQFPYPPIELQHRFCIIANEIDKKKRIFNGHFSHLDSLFKALQHRAFQGEL